MKRKGVVDSYRLGLYLLCILGLVPMLLYTFWHTGSLMARMIDPDWLGYVAAAGSEILIAVLSVYRTQTTHRGFVAVALIGVLVISAVANVHEGYAAWYGRSPRLSDLLALDVVPAVAGLLATGAVSILVYVVGEVIGGNAAQAVRIVAEEPRKVSEGPACEFCDGSLKDTRSTTRANHLRYCLAYRGRKNGKEPIKVTEKGENSV